MKFAVNHLWLPKLGNEETEYEDAFAPKLDGLIDQPSLSLALADGATDSSFAAEWAKMLTRSFVKEPITSIEILQYRTDFLSKRWQTIVNRRPLPWYAEEKMRLGAFATLLGVQFRSNPNLLNQSGFWSAIAIGDTCLFQVRNDKLVNSFPISDAFKFGNSPMLLSSNLARNSQLWENVRFLSDKWVVGDIFLLSTDALACWFLSEYDRDKRPWNILLDIIEDSNPFLSFRTWADDLRKSSQLKNDDITILLVRL